MKRGRGNYAILWGSERDMLEVEKGLGDGWLERQSCNLVGGAVAKASSKRGLALA